MTKLYKIVLASREHGPLQFQSFIVKANSRKEAMQIGRNMERPEDLVWFRGDMSGTLVEGEGAQG